MYLFEILCVISFPVKVVKVKSVKTQGARARVRARVGKLFFYSGHLLVVCERNHPLSFQGEIGTAK